MTDKFINDNECETDLQIKINSKKKSKKKDETLDVSWLSKVDKKETNVVWLENVKYHNKLITKDIWISEII